MRISEKTNSNQSFGMAFKVYGAKKLGTSSSIKAFTEAYPDLVEIGKDYRMALFFTKSETHLLDKVDAFFNLNTKKSFWKSLFTSDFEPGYSSDKMDITSWNKDSYINTANEAVESYKRLLIEYDVKKDVEIAEKAEKKAALKEFKAVKKNLEAK